MNSARTKLDHYTPRSKTVRYLAGYLAMFLSSLVGRCEVSGRKHIPKKGPFIVASNHFSYIDPAFVIQAIGRPINFLAASDQKIDWYFMWAPWLYGFIPTNRVNIAPSTIKTSIKVLKQGNILGIFPEGTSTSTELRKAKNGVVYLSTVTNAQIVPVGITGLESAWEDLFRGIRPRVKINIGKPFGTFYLPRGKDKKEQHLDEIGTEVMCRIAALIPENQHGTVKGKKRIKDFQTENDLTKSVS